MRTTRKCPNPKCGSRQMTVTRTYVTHLPDGSELAVHHGTCDKCGARRDQQEALAPTP